MNLESLYQKINRPEMLDAADIPALKDLCVKYPYAQLFSILYLKALAQSKDLHFEDELQQHAYKITDRAKLFDLIHANETSASENVKTQYVASHPEEIIRETIANEDQENVKPEDFPAQPEESVKPQHVAASEETSEEKEDLPAQPEETQAETPNPAPQREIDELEKEILSGVMAAAYSLELEESVKPEDLPSQDVDLQKKDSAAEKTDLSENRSFTSWLKLASDKESIKPEDLPVQPETNELIEKFIKDEPERIKPKAEFYSAPKKAKESVSEDKLVYTETLANIYALQGNYPKAITAFQQLMLTIPEKKLYFAQKIEELNKKINS